MIIGFNSERSSEHSIEFTIDQFEIVVIVDNGRAAFTISNAKIPKEETSGTLIFDCDTPFTLNFEYTPGMPYIYINLGPVFFQFKREDYGVVIDAFTTDGEVLKEYGYVLDEEE